MTDQTPATDQVPVLECRNLSISYFTRAGEIPAVVDFNLKLMPGEAHGIVGESGCGKSTVALAIMQYLGQNGRIVGGELLFDGRDMRTMSEEELRSWVKDRLRSSRTPQRIDFRDELPYNELGKLLRRKLREEMLGEEK